MNFQQLRHFVVTAQAGNIVKAAQILYISQSGLSRSISALENLIGLPLFERSPKGVTLTEFGRHFLPGAQLMLNQHRRYVDELKAFRELRAGSVTVGINHSFAYLVMPQALRELLKRWPSVQVSIVTDNYQALVEQLINGDIDFALSLYTDPGMHDELDYEWLCDFRTVVLAREGHPLFDRKTVDIASLSAANWALIKGGSANETFSTVFDAHDVPQPTISLRCASVVLLTAIVEETDLLTMLPEELVASTGPSRLRRVPVEGFFGQARVGLIRRHGAGELPIAEKLAGSIRRHVMELHNTHSGPTVAN